MRCWPSATSISRKSASARWGTSPAPAAPSSWSATNSIRSAAFASGSSGLMLPPCVRTAPPTKSPPPTNPPCSPAAIARRVWSAARVYPPQREPKRNSFAGKSPSLRLRALTSLGPVTVNFAVELAEPISSGEHGIALFNAERQLMWARAAQKLSLRPGVHVLSHTFPSLPLRPGAYQWQVSLWDNGEVLDLWDCSPEMAIATEIHQHYMDEWNGLLNLPSDLKILNQRENHIANTI